MPLESELTSVTAVFDNMTDDVEEEQVSAATQSDLSTPDSFSPHYGPASALVHDRGPVGLSAAPTFHMCALMT